jgi:hypothetical protein
MDFYGAEVRKKTEFFAELQEPLLRPYGSAWVVPFRSANRTKKDCLRFLARSKSFIAKGVPDLVNGTSTDELFTICEFVPHPSCYLIKNFDGFPDYFGTNPVTREKNN